MKMKMIDLIRLLKSNNKISKVILFKPLGALLMLIKIMKNKMKLKILFKFN